MAWFSRLTRFGQVHMCYAQEASDSCGIASSIMVNFKLKAGSTGSGTIAKALFPSLGAITGKLLGGAGNQTAVLAERQVYALVGAGYDGSTGTTGAQVARLLNQLNIGDWVAVDPCPSNLIAGYVLAGYRSGWPTIIGNSWYRDKTHSAKGGGGHWVVADTVNRFSGSLYASLCDPLDGNVHVTKFTEGSDFLYDPTDPIGVEVTISAGDSAKAYPEGYAKQGYSRMDGVVYCRSSPRHMIGTSGLFAV